MDLPLSLPWQIQASLAIGYAAYFLAYVGIRFSHQAVDVFFRALIFGVIANLIIWQVRMLHPALAIAIAFLGALALGLFWRRFARGWVHAALHFFNVSWADDDPSAPITLSRNTKYRVSQVAVELQDGTWLRCENTAQFADAPFGPFTLGPNGDMLMYLTHIDEKDGASKELKTVRHEAGDRINYIPAASIRQVTLRHVRA
jgi:hypothetical protein